MRGQGARIQQSETLWALALLIAADNLSRATQRQGATRCAHVADGMQLNDEMHEALADDAAGVRCRRQRLLKDHALMTRIARHSERFGWHFARLTSSWRHHRIR